jgi:dTDP-4-amino-4,6-dideoxygalactose transaminase
MSPNRTIKMLDLAAQRRRLEPEMSQAIQRVLDHGQFIMGPEVQELERQLELFTGAKHAVTCANGTDALVLVMMAEGIGPGDAVVVPSFTFAATAEAVALRGATPVFADVDEATYNISPASAERCVHEARRLGLRPRAIIAVDLFGLPADYQSLSVLADSQKLRLVADAAQSFGASLAGRHVGTLADYTTTSFFPSKPLGCYGDGGAVMTNDGQAADLLRSLRSHGKGTDKYDNIRVGLNSRLDTLQAAVLLVKLPLLLQEIATRLEHAKYYIGELHPSICRPVVSEDPRSAWAQFTVKCRSSSQRSLIIRTLDESHIGHAIYYPVPLHNQSAYRGWPSDPDGLANAGDLAQRVLSLPLSAYLWDDDVPLVVDIVNHAAD